MSHTQNTHKKLWFTNGDRSARYAQVPAQLMLDSRLAPRHVQIMMVLILHASRETGVCKISRETIADYTGYSIAVISKATTALSEFGWLDKGRQWSNANVYRVTLPVFDAGVLRDIQNRRLPDDVWAARQAEVLERQERFRIERREQYAADLAEVGAKLVEGAAPEFDGIAMVNNFDASLHAAENQSETVIKAVSVASPIATPRKSAAFAPLVKPRSQVVAALREYLTAKIEEPEISDKDLDFYGFSWGDNPDLPLSRTIYDDVVESGSDFDGVPDDIAEYEVPENFT